MDFEEVTVMVSSNISRLPPTLGRSRPTVHPRWISWVGIVQDGYGRLWKVMEGYGICAPNIYIYDYNICIQLIKMYTLYRWVINHLNDAWGCINWVNEPLTMWSLIRGSPLLLQGPQL